MPCCYCVEEQPIFSNLEQAEIYQVALEAYDGRKRRVYWCVSCANGWRVTYAINGGYTKEWIARLQVEARCARETAKSKKSKLIKRVKSKLSRVQLPLPQQGETVLCWICELPIQLVGKWNLLSFTRDHVIPRSKGGRDFKSNLRPAHSVCNNIRGNFDVTEEIRALCKQRVKKILEEENK